MFLLKQHRLAVFIFLLVAHLALATAYSAFNPLGEAPDEVDHWSYIIFLVREKRLADTPRLTQGKHPPFYHATAAAIASLARPAFKFLRANPDVELQPSATGAPNFFIHTTLEDWPWHDGALAFHLARLWSVFLSTCTVAAAYGLMRRAFPRQPSLAVTTTGVLAFLPEFAFIGGAVNNDNAAALFGALALFGAFAIYRAKGQVRAGWWTPIALGLGVLAKVSTFALWPIIGCILLWGILKPELNKLGFAETDPRVGFRSLVIAISRTWRQWLPVGLLVFGPALLIAAPWLVRNWRLYGDPLGMAFARQTVDLRTTPWTWADTWWLARGWFISFWGKFGGAGQIGMGNWIYWLLAALTLLSAIGLVRRWLQQREGRMVTFFLAVASLSVIVSIWRYSLIALGTDQGRLLYPALAPLTALFVIGCLAWSPAHHVDKVGACLVFGSFLFGLYGLFGVIRPVFAPPPNVQPRALADLSMTRVIHFGELALIDWDLTENPTLYWRAQQQPSQDWRTILRVTTKDGQVVWEWRRSPGSGRWSTDHWPVGAIVKDAYAIRWPDWAGPGQYFVEIGLQPFGGDLVTPQDEQAPKAKPEEQFIRLGWLERLPNP